MATHQDAEQRVQTGFWVHLFCYVAVVGGLAFLNFQRSPDNPWVLWVAGGWGLGLAAHAAGYFTSQGRERMIDRTEARMDRREARQDRRESRNHGRDMTDRMSEASDHRAV